jgi:hypothetical protein
VYRRSFFSFLCAALLLAVAATATAAPRDAAAKRKINEAINTQYLATKFDKAEQLILGTIRACGNECSPPVLARAWMYVGIVRGSGKNDQAGAAEAFKKALRIDPNVQLDGALATPDTKKTFAAAQSGGGGGTTNGGGGTTNGGGGTEETPHHHHPSGENVPGEMSCTPKVTEVEKRRPIPVSCTTDEEAVRGELRYKAYGDQDWHTVLMHKKGDQWQATIPCSATMTAGTLKMHVRVKDHDGDTVDSFGSMRHPYEFKIVAQTDAEPPHYPDQDPPERCAEQVECPPDFPGCKSGGAAKHGSKAWGDSCSSSDECKAGLACVNGSCDTAQSCTEDADCAQGKCVSGSCQTESSGGGGGPSGPYKKNWFGIHIGEDLAIVGGSDVCTKSSQENDGFACFASGTSVAYPEPGVGYPVPGRADKISTGIAAATTRFMLSYDRAFTPNILAGVRLGYAIGGGPKSGNKSFLPIHGELDVQYWFGGKDAIAKKGFRGYGQLGGGVAQVDAKLPVTVCPTTLASCNEQTAVKLDAYKKLGQSFVTLGGGAMYAVTPSSGVQLNVNLMYMLPTSGLVIEPSLGYIFGL